MKAVMNAERLKDDKAFSVRSRWVKPSRMPTTPKEKLAMVNKITTITKTDLQLFINPPV